MQETKNIYEKLSIVKSEIGFLSKNAQNPFFRSTYLDLNGILTALEPLLESNGLLLLQPIEESKVVTYIFDAQQPENFIQSSIPLPNIVDPQKLGSAITYFRRYTLQSLLALQAVDDDSNLATKSIQGQAKQSPMNEAQFKKALTKIINKERTAKQLRNAYSLAPSQEAELEKLEQ